MSCFQYNVLFKTYAYSLELRKTAEKYRDESLSFIAFYCRKLLPVTKVLISWGEFPDGYHLDGYQLLRIINAQKAVVLM